MSSGEVRVEPPHLTLVQVLLLAIPAASVLFAALIWPAQVRGVFTTLYGYLPLTLPVISVAMGIALDPRGLSKLEGWLRLTNSIALGLVAFAIWYFVASQSPEPYVRVGGARFLKGAHSLLLLILSFAWVGYVSVVGVFTDLVPGSVGALRIRVVNLMLSVAFLIAPIAFFQARAEAETELGHPLDLKTFAVSIPYRDAALDYHLGRSTSPLTLAIIFTDVRATTPTAAVESALSRFATTPQYWQSRRDASRARTDTTRQAVEILRDGIVAQERR